VSVLASRLQEAIDQGVAGGGPVPLSRRARTA
jgi:hypothetical protein